MSLLASMMNLLRIPSHRRKKEEEENKRGNGRNVLVPGVLVLVNRLQIKSIEVDIDCFQVKNIWGN